HSGLDFDQAVANTRTLMQAAAEAGVRKVVHVSVSNPSADSPLPYYAGKAQAEDAVRESGLAYAIVRPTLVFGPGDILINNIAWLLRNVPVFAIPGLGHYKLQPVAAEDVAEIAVWAGQQADSVTVDAAGPEIITYMDLVDEVAIAVHRRPPVLYLPPSHRALLCKKGRSSVRWSGEKVLDQLRGEAVVRVAGEPDDRKPDGSAPLGEGAVLGGGRQQRLPLARAHRLQRRPECVARAR